MRQLVPFIETVLDLRHRKQIDSCNVQSDCFLCFQICRLCMPNGDGLSWLMVYQVFRFTMPDWLRRFFRMAQRIS